VAGHQGDFVVGTEDAQLVRQDLSITATSPAEAIEAYLTCDDEDFAPAACGSPLAASSSR
jgi:hypothetical protein